MAYRDMDPREVLIEVIGYVEEAKMRLRRAEAKMIGADLADKPGYREIAEFISLALRNANVATHAVRRTLEKR